MPAVDELIDATSTPPFLPDIQVADRDLELPRTWSFSTGVDRDLGRGLAASATFVHARTDNLFRFVDRNDPSLGAPFGIGTHPSGGGINALTVTESSARSRYRALTLGLRGRGSVRSRPLTFETHYTLAFDRSDDDNERDPFTLRYASAANLAPEYGWSDRDRRHQVSGYLLLTLPGEVQVNHVVRYITASPVSEQCANRGARVGPAVGPRLRRRDDPHPQHPAPGQRVLHLGPAPVPPLRAGGRRRHRAHRRGVQPHQRRQLPRHGARLAAVSTSTGRSGAASATPGAGRWGLSVRF